MQAMYPLSEAKARLSELVREAAEREVVLLRHSRVAAVLISPQRYEALLEEIEDLKDRLSVYEAQPDLSMPWEKAKAELGLLSAE